MAIFKCKMCGGTLEISNETVAVCEYCGTQQTLPKLSDERRVNLYDRANHFRRNNEFDKAISIYEQILNEDNSDAEAYWSLVLCRYGIEYVEDPASRKRLPTVNRAQFTSIFDDDNYKSALQYADASQKSIYEEEAKAINEIQKGILAISQKEEPFDVFICYKETDNNGRRTPDSVLANDLYHQLTQEGFKVFFARITLEDKLGSAYEPYIFAALNSAKVMVVLGTKPDYFNAVWVKNEWSRYLGLIKGGAKKMLIPAYKDMDPYDLPEEFSHLQAQDMSKLGFMQDLIRGIKKITQTDEPKATVITETVVAPAASAVAPLLERAFMFLEDGDWEKADEFCENVLNQDPKCAEAYLGKLMAELHVKKREDLKNQKNSFAGKNSYQKALRFASAELKAEMEKYSNTVIYTGAEQKMQTAETEEAYLAAAEIFAKISGWKDADNKVAECKEKAEVACKDSLYNAAKTIMAKDAISEYETAEKKLASIPGWKDADELLATCRRRIEEIVAQKEAARKDNILIEAKRLMMSDTIGDYEDAIKVLVPIHDWKDADELLATCRCRIDEILAEQEAARLERERQEEAARKEAAKKAKRNKKIALIATSAICAILVFALVLNFVIIPAAKYNKACALMEEGQYRQAVTTFLSTSGYKDSAEKIAEARTHFGKQMDGVTIVAGNYHTVGLKADGTVVAAGRNFDGQCDVSEWTDIVAVAAGENHTVGLKSDGTVVAMGLVVHGRCDVADWIDIVAIAAGAYHTVGLKADGTVVAVGSNTRRQCNVAGWDNIVAIAAGENHTVGLKADGTVVAVGYNKDGRCNVSNWENIVAIAAGAAHTVGLKADGSVVAVGYKEDGQCDVADWTDIVAVAAGNQHTVGLKVDGTVVAVGYNNDGKYDLSGWTDIVAIATGRNYTIGLKADGTVVAVGDRSSGQCDVSDWTDIRIP